MLVIARRWSPVLQLCSRCHHVPYPSCIPCLCPQVAVTGKLAKQLSAETQGMATRAVPVQVRFNPAAQASQSAQQGLVVQPSQDLAWNERFVLTLPSELSEQLLTPAPGDNPFEGVALRLKVTVMDGSGERGLGRVLTCTEVPVTFNWLLSQIQALLAVRADAAAAATAAAAAVSGPASVQQSQQQQQQQGGADSGLPPGSAQAAAKAGDKAGKDTATRSARAYNLGLQQTLQLWKAGTGPPDASPQGPAQQPGSGQAGSSSSTSASASAAVAAATAAAAAVAADDGEDAAAPVMQLKIKLSLDDSQVSSSWYPHQLMRRRLTQLLSSSGSLSSPQLQLTRPTRQGSRPLGTDSRSPQTQQQMAGGSWARGSGGGSNARNALRLEGSDVWSPFSYTSLRRLTGALAGAPHSGVVPVRAGPGLVLELAYLGKCHHSSTNTCMLSLECIRVQYNMILMVVT
jgi:vacuolar protein sorting-associated protein 13A/C